MGQYEKHVFVCTSGKTCPRQGSLDLLSSLRKELRAREPRGEIRISKSGCMAQCGHGPMVVVYPADVWYGAVRVEDVAELIESHILGGVPLERCRYQSPGPGKQICKPGDEAIPLASEG